MAGYPDGGRRRPIEQRQAASMRSRRMAGYPAFPFDAGVFLKLGLQ